MYQVYSYMYYKNAQNCTVNGFTLQITSDQLGDLYRQFVDNYPIVSIEDPYDQDDWEAYTKLTGSVQIQIVGSVLTHNANLVPAV